MSSSRINPESNVEVDIVALALSLGYSFEMKVMQANKRGIPDRWFIKFGPTVKVIEVKQPGEEPTPQQWRRINELRELGIDAWWADSVESARVILER